MAPSTGPGGAPAGTCALERAATLQQQPELMMQFIELEEDLKALWWFKR